MKTYILLLLGVTFFGACQHKQYLRPATADEVSKIQGMVHFDFNRWRLRPDQEKVVMEKARLMKRYPKTAVILEGHTDPVGSAAYNLQLGDRRARKVKHELVNEGVEPDRVVVVSFGESRPRDPRRTREADLANRRVELRVK